MKRFINEIGFIVFLLYRFLTNWFTKLLPYKATVIVAVDEFNGYGIGLNGGIPWFSHEDLKHFKDTTSKPVNRYCKTVKNIMICGSKTYKTLPKFKDRHVIVLTNNPESCIDPTLQTSLVRLGCNCYVINDVINKTMTFFVKSVNDIHLMLRFIEDLQQMRGRVYVIGGDSVYTQLLYGVKNISVTECIVSFVGLSIGKYARKYDTTFPFVYVVDKFSKRFTKMLNDKVFVHYYKKSFV